MDSFRNSLTFQNNVNFPGIVTIKYVDIIALNKTAKWISENVSSLVVEMLLIKNTCISPKLVLNWDCVTDQIVSQLNPTGQDNARTQSNQSVSVKYEIYQTALLSLIDFAGPDIYTLR